MFVNSQDNTQFVNQRIRVDWFICVFGTRNETWM